MLLNAQEVRQIYHRTARFYDAAVWLYRVAGVHRHRQLAVTALALRPGDTVVDMGCGTGLNFSLLHAAVGPTGRIIGVDLSGAMLERARRRVANAGWENVELVEANLPKYLNSPESPVYHKGRTLYGLGRSRNAIRRAEAALVVEGYMDFLALAAHGVENAVALLGTAMTGGPGGAEAVSRRCGGRAGAQDSDPGAARCLRLHLRHPARRGRAAAHGARGHG